VIFKKEKPAKVRATGGEIDFSAPSKSDLQQVIEEHESS